MNTALPAILSRRQHALLGLLVGDAYGVPYEFHPPLPVSDVAMPPPPTFARSHRSAPDFAWSDDGAQALALVDALHGRSWTNDWERIFKQSLVLWMKQGAYAVNGRVFDIGAHTARVLGALERGRNAEAADLAATPEAYGNGSLMRSLPAALCASHDGDAVGLARLASSMTHDSTLCREACALYVCVARVLLDGGDPREAWLLGVARYARSVGSIDPAKLIVPDADARRGTGYVLHGLNLCRLALGANLSWEQSVREVISLGGDTDSNAAIVGGLLACRESGVPLELVAKLPRPEWMVRVLGKLP